ncbi:hypothetical protein JW906_11040 [bacterium]|nr:hypothetical protein [bacterium]
MKNDSATKADLKKTADGLHQEISGVETRLKARLTETGKKLQKEIAATKTGLRKEITASKNELTTSFKAELREEIATVRTELTGRIDSVENKLDRRIEHVAVAVVQVSADLNEFKQETRERFNEVMNSMDGLAKNLMDVKTEMIEFNHAFNRHENTLEDHEARIGVLEGKGP